MDGNTEGRRLREEAAAFSVWRAAHALAATSQRLIVSFSMFSVILPNASDSSGPLAAS